MAGTMQRNGNELLRDLLATLIKQWGRDEVMQAVLDFDESGISKFKELSSSRLLSEPRKRPEAVRPNAVSIAEKVDVPVEKRMLLINLASRWDHKAFLPTVADVRNFLEMRGVEARNVKQRQDAFRKVVKAIVDMPNETLERMLKSSMHSGPSQLGPLSDAIKATGSALRAQDKNPEKPQGATIGQDHQRQARLIDAAENQHENKRPNSDQHAPLDSLSQSKEVDPVDVEVQHEGEKVDVVERTALNREDVERSDREDTSPSAAKRVNLEEKRGSKVPRKEPRR